MAQGCRPSPGASVRRMKTGKERKAKPRERRGNRITRVTTRQGDGGLSRLADGTQLPKTAAVFAAMGDVDELNSQVGALLAEVAEEDLAALLREVQQQLFDLGAHLATGGQTVAPEPQRIEAQTEAMNAALPPLAEFVLPGGRRAGAAAHVCRAVCRRAERSLWGAESQDGGRYLNRLGDFLFVLARALNAGEELPENLWRGSRPDA